MKVYGRTTSFNVQKVMWLVEELALSYEHIELGGRFGGLETEEFQRLNPMQKVPVLLDDDKTIWESHTILRYLIAGYGCQAWYPKSAYERSLYERWSDWSQVVFQPAFMGVFWGYYRTPPEKRNMTAINESLAICVDCLDILEQQLCRSRYLAGDSISLAEITVGSILYRLTESGVDVELPPKVEKWYRNLIERDGYRKWVMSDFSELKAREDF